MILFLDKEIFMECDRCQGVMLEDSFVAMVGPSQQDWRCAWRCLDCGHATDASTLATHQKGVEYEILFGTGGTTEVV
jgi:hypothetical protein